MDTQRTKIKIMSYNIRCLRGGHSGAGYGVLDEETINTTVANMRALLEREDPDVLIICENRIFLDGEAFDYEGGSKPVYDLIFKDYFPYTGCADQNINYPLIYSKHEVKEVNFLPVNYPEAATEKNRRPVRALIEIDDRDVEVIACHAIAGAEYANIDRVAYFNAVINYAKYKDHVIIAGDMNTDSDDPLAEYKPFIDARFKLGNFGAFGQHVTYRYGSKGNMIDNIIVRGMTLDRFWVGTEDYSDHFPVYAEAYLPKK